MTRPTLTVVGKGGPVVDTSMADCLRDVLALVEAGEVSGLFVMYEPSNGDQPEFHITGEALRMVALTELYMDTVKAVALGVE